MDKQKTKRVLETTVKSLFGAIPYVGGLLDEVIFEHRARLKQHRINVFINKLTEYFDSTAKRLIDINDENLKSEDFSDIFEKILYSVAKTSAEEKIELFKTIAVKRMKARNTSFDLENIFIDITNSISVTQLLILKRYVDVPDEDLQFPVDVEREKYRGSGSIRIPGYSAEKRRQEGRVKYERWKNIQDPNDPNSHALNPEVFLLNITDLISKGLILAFGNRDESVDQHKYFGVSILGRKYIDYVTE